MSYMCLVTCSLNEWPQGYSLVNLHKVKLNFFLNKPYNSDLSIHYMQNNLDRSVISHFGQISDKCFATKVHIYSMSCQTQDVDVLTQPLQPGLHQIQC